MLSNNDFFHLDIKFPFKINLFKLKIKSESLHIKIKWILSSENHEGGSRMREVWGTLR